jgi:hypothetical protein
VVFTAVTIKNAVFWDVMRCGSCYNGLFVGICHLVTANFVTSSLILSTLKMEAMHSSETSVLPRATWLHISEDGILHVSRNYRKIF